MATAKKNQWAGNALGYKSHSAPAVQIMLCRRCKWAGGVYVGEYAGYHDVKERYQLAAGYKQDACRVLCTQELRDRHASAGTILCRCCNPVSSDVMDCDLWELADDLKAELLAQDKLQGGE